MNESSLQVVSGALGGWFCQWITSRWQCATTHERKSTIEIDGDNVC